MVNSKRLNIFASRAKFLLSKQTADQVWYPFVLPLAGVDLDCRYSWSSLPDSTADRLMICCAHEISQLERAYLEAFCDLASSLSWAKIDILGTREVENYLRDDNVTPAHDQNTTQTTPGLWIDALRSSIFSGWLKARFSTIKALPQALDCPIELTKWLRQASGEDFWGKKLKPEYLSYEAVALIAPSETTSGTFEVQWRFDESTDSEQAQIFCLSLEQFLQSKNLKVKVVAES
tara:strand:- start:7927 stop:8625 length:699 start_codon:yes stop_codon:yes gene_type:complete